jgi:hypothetical protein
MRPFPFQANNWLAPWFLNYSNVNKFDLQLYNIISKKASSYWTQNQIILKFM